MQKPRHPLCCVVLGACLALGGSLALASAADCHAPPGGSVGKKACPDAAVPAAEHAKPLAGSSWRLVAMPSPGGAPGRVEIPPTQAYLVRFNEDGNASFRLDCNRGFGGWKMTLSGEASGQLTFGTVAVTRAMCPPGSFDSEVAQSLSRIRSWRIGEGRLYLSLTDDGGVLEWVDAPEFGR